MPAPNAIALPASLPSRRTRNRRCLPSPTVARSPSSQPGASSVISGLPRPNGASRASSVHRSSVKRVPRGTTASMRVTGCRSSSTSSPAACSANARANASTFSGLIESPAAARWPPQRPSSSAHAAKPAVQVERRDRPPRALPVAVRAGDQHDRPVEALDEPRRDDADHALVPALAGDDVRVTARAAPRATPRPAPRPRGRSAPRPPAARGSDPRARSRAASPRRDRRSAAARARSADARAAPRR